MIAYLLGLLNVALSPSIALLSLTFVLTLLVLVLALKYSSRAGWNRWVLYFGLGGVVGLVPLYLALEARISAPEKRIELCLTGQVVSLASSAERGFQSFVLEVEPLSDYKIDRVRLSLYRAEPRIREGDHLTVTARLTPPTGYRNLSGPDRVARDLYQGIDARGYISEIITHRASPSIREQLSDQIQRLYPSEHAGFLRALILGETSSLSDTQWQRLRDTGTLHLAIVSGLHMAIVTGAGIALGYLLVYLLIRLRVIRQPRWSHRLPWWLGFVFATVYLVLGGSGLPLQRAWVMASALLAGRLVDRVPDVWARLKLALVLVTLIQPLVVLQLGFWLSFGLVFMLAGLGQFRSELGWFRLTLLTQLCLSLVMVPLLVAGSGQLNLNALLSNLWAIPLVSLGVATMPVLLPASFYLDEVRWLIEQWSALFWSLLERQSQIGLVSDWPAPELFLTPLALLGVLLILLPIRMRTPGLLLLILFLGQPSPRPESGEFWVELFDVGQGQSALIQTQDRVVIYDTAARYPSGFAAASLTLVPRLRALGITEIDQLILSHSDADHAGGLGRLQELFKIRSLVSGQPAETGGVGCEGFQTLRSAGVSFHWFKLETTPVTQDNDHSCSLLVDNGVCRFLIMGDLSADRELTTVRRFVDQPVTWFQLSHHGSVSSTSPALLDQLRPSEAFISRGAYNRFGHPHPRVIEYLTHACVPYQDTAQVGQIRLLASTGGCISESVAERAAYWWR